MRSAGEGLVILIIGAAAVWGASLVPPPPEGETWAGVLPMGAAICMTLAGVLMTLSGFRASDAKADKETPIPQPVGQISIKVLGLFIVGILYHQAILKFGYELSTAIIGPAVLWMFGVRNKAGIALSVILFPVVFHVLFFKLLGVFPPIGELLDLMDYLRG